MSSQPDAEQIKLAKSLADPSKDIRQETVTALDKRLAALTSMTDMDMLKLWKALYYCMWLSDKAAIQAELADSLSKLSFSFKKLDLVLLFHRMFYRTVIREWTQLDQHRINKFYVFIRSMLRYSFSYMMKNNWKSDLIQSFMNILDEEILCKTPNGLRFHLSDIFLAELLDVTKGSISTKVFVQCLSPYLKAIKSTKDQIFHDRIASSIFQKFLTTSARECESKRPADGDGDGENDGPESTDKPIFYFTSVKTTAIQKLVFDIAASEEIGEGNRRKVYAIHKAFFATTGKQFIEEDETESEEIVEAAQNSSKSASKSLATEKEGKSGKKRKSDAGAAVDTPSLEIVKETKASKVVPTKVIPVEKPKIESQEVVEKNVAQISKKQKKTSSEEAAKVEATAASEKKTPSVAESESSAAPVAPVPFIAAKKFAGAKNGYVFQMGKQGLGYYLDKMKPKKATVKGASDLVKGGKSPIEDFIPSAKFVGARYGYTHKSGPLGTGYYHDLHTSASRTNSRTEPMAKSALAHSSKFDKQPKKSALSSGAKDQDSVKSVKFGKNKISRF